MTNVSVPFPPGSVPRPVFIVAAPRSGSTLVFETLAASDNYCTLGGEAHWLVEGLAPLRPGAPGVDSNRLDAAHATDAIVALIRGAICARAGDRHGRAAADRCRLLEKTPKNALRIPFFDRIFPDALFIFLWRDPRENVASIMNAWREGRWTTYRGLDGFDGPWSLLLPPGWRALRGKALEEIAAYQWECTNRIVLEDLALLPIHRWTSVEYATFLADPAAVVKRLCAFAQIDFDTPLAQRVSGPLPHSRYTLTVPAREKWRRDEVAIERVLPSIEPVWRRLLALDVR